jgi:hypothetical protein
MFAGVERFGAKVITNNLVNGLSELLKKIFVTVPVISPIGVVL